MERVLVVEDSPALQRALRRLFEADGLEVQVAADRAVALQMFRSGPPAAVVLDPKLPRLSGKELCREFKSLVPSVPIVILSANDQVEEKVVLLELGADDYVTKPFSSRELLARVRRAMRHAKPPWMAQLVTLDVLATSFAHEKLAFANIEVDFTAMEATRDGTPLALTAREFKLLKFLVTTSGRVNSREEVLKHVWRDQSYASTRAVDNYILHLRQKLEPDPSNPQFFLTVHGAGYKFVPGNTRAPIYSKA